MCIYLESRLGREAYYEAIPNLLEFCPSNEVRAKLLKDVEEFMQNDYEPAEVKASKKMLDTIEDRLDKGGAIIKMRFRDSHQDVIQEIREWIRTARNLNNAKIERLQLKDLS